MKRGFLFGLGSFLLFIAFAPFQAGRPNASDGIISLLLITLAFITLYFARQAPSHLSKLHAIVGWLLGFFALWAAVIAAVMGPLLGVLFACLVLLLVLLAVVFLLVLLVRVLCRRLRELWLR